MFIKLLNIEINRNKKGRAKIRIKRLKNIFYLIEKKYNVEAFLFSFLKKY